MKFNVTSAAAAALATAALFTLPLGAAEARSWRSYVDQYGGGKWVDKYVEEDKNGNVRYKGSKNDTWSGEYYDSKTGKWTGKKYDGESSSKSSSKASSTRSAKRGTTTLKSAKSNTTSASSKAALAKVTESKKAAPQEATQASGSEDATSTGPAYAAGPALPQSSEGQMYGPPAPPELKTSAALD
jgi:hypothetical protein